MRDKRVCLYLHSLKPDTNSHGAALPNMWRGGWQNLVKRQGGNEGGGRVVVRFLGVGCEATGAFSAFGEKSRKQAASPFEKMEHLTRGDKTSRGREKSLSPLDAARLSLLSRGLHACHLYFWPQQTQSQPMLTLFELESQGLRPKPWWSLTKCIRPPSGKELQGDVTCQITSCQEIKGQGRVPKATNLQAKRTAQNLSKARRPALKVTWVWLEA